MIGREIISQLIKSNIDYCLTQFIQVESVVVISHVTYRKQPFFLSRSIWPMIIVSEENILSA